MSSSRTKTSAFTPLAPPVAPRGEDSTQRQHPRPSARRRHVSAALLPASGWRWRGCRGCGGLVLNLHGDQLHLPVRVNIRQAWGRLELAFPLDPGDPVGGAVAFRLVGLFAPEPMLLSTSRRTSPPAAAKFESAYERGHGWEVEHRTSWGRDNIRGRPLRGTHEFTHPQSDVAVNNITQHCMRFWDGQHTVVAEGVRTQARGRHRKRVAKGVDPRQTGEIVGDPGRETHRKNRNDGQPQEVKTVGDHEGVPDGPVQGGPISPDRPRGANKPRRQRN